MNTVYIGYELRSVVVDVLVLESGIPSLFRKQHTNISTRIINLTDGRCQGLGIVMLILVLRSHENCFAALVSNIRIIMARSVAELIKRREFNSSADKVHQHDTRNILRLL